MSQRGSQSAILLNLPSLHTPVRCCHRPPWAPRVLQVTLPSLGCAKDLSPPVSEMPISLRIGLARRQGVSATTRAQAGFAKRLITKAGLVPTKPHGSPSEPSFTWCLELGVSCNYCLAVLPAPGPFSPDLGGTPSWNPHITPRPCWVLPVPNSHGDTAHGYLMSMGYGEGRGCRKLWQGWFWQRRWPQVPSFPWLLLDQ